GRTEKSERRGTEAQLEEPAAPRRNEVVVAFRPSAREDLDLGGIEPEIGIKRRGLAVSRIRIRQQDTRRTTLEEYLPVRRLVELREALCDENDRGVLLAQRQEPLPDPLREGRLHQRQPCLLNDDQGRRAGEPLLHPMEEVGEHRQED